MGLYRHIMCQQLMGLYRHIMCQQILGLYRHIMYPERRLVARRLQNFTDKCFTPSQNMHEQTCRTIQTAHRSKHIYPILRTLATSFCIWNRQDTGSGPMHAKCNGVGTKFAVSTMKKTKRTQQKPLSKLPSATTCRPSPIWIGNLACAPSLIILEWICLVILFVTQAQYTASSTSAPSLNVSKNRDSFAFLGWVLRFRKLALAWARSNKFFFFAEVFVEELAFLFFGFGCFFFFGFLTSCCVWTVSCKPSAIMAIFCLACTAHRLLLRLINWNIWEWLRGLEVCSMHAQPGRHCTLQQQWAVERALEFELCAGEWKWQDCDKPQTNKKNGHIENHSVWRFSRGWPIMRCPLHKAKEYYGMLDLHSHIIFDLRNNFCAVACDFVWYIGACSWTVAPIPKHMARIPCLSLTVRQTQTCQV